MLTAPTGAAETASTDQRRRKPCEPRVAPLVDESQLALQHGLERWLERLHGQHAIPFQTLSTESCIINTVSTKVTKPSPSDLLGGGEDSVGVGNLMGRIVQPVPCFGSPLLIRLRVDEDIGSFPRQGFRIAPRHVLTKRNCKAQGQLPHRVTPISSVHADDDLLRSCLDDTQDRAEPNFTSVAAGRVVVACCTASAKRAA